MAWTTPGTATAGEVLTAAFWNTQVRDNMVELAPFSEAWTSYTPTIGGFTLGNGTITGGYLKVGRFVNIRIKFVLGSTSGTSSFLTFTVPFAIASQSEIAAGSCMFLDGGTRYLGTVLNGPSNTSFEVLAVNASATYATLAPIQATVPFSWGANDEVFVRFSYQATS